jgi:replicative DNA helicase
MQTHNNNERPNSQNGGNDSNLPANLAAEREVLGAIIEADVLPEVVEAGLQVGHFLLSDHRRIFAAMLALRDKNQSVDVITLSEKLGNRPEDIALLSDLITGVVLARGHIQHHVAIVRQKARLRALIKFGEWAALSANESGADPDALVKAVADKLEYLG